MARQAQFKQAQCPGGNKYEYQKSNYQTFKILLKLSDDSGFLFLVPFQFLFFVSFEFSFEAQLQ